MTSDHIMIAKQVVTAHCSLTGKETDCLLLQLTKSTKPVPVSIKDIGKQIAFIVQASQTGVIVESCVLA